MLNKISAFELSRFSYLLHSHLLHAIGTIFAWILQDVPRRRNTILALSRLGKTSQCSVHTVTASDQCFPAWPRSISKRLLSSDYRLVDHVIESLVTDELDCGFRCVRNKKCQSYNCYADGHHGNKTCQLNSQTRHSKPNDFRANKESTYHGKGREITTAVHQTSKFIRLRQRVYTNNLGNCENIKGIKTWKLVLLNQDEV